MLITTSTWATSDDCSRGPEYWCRDEVTAKECGATRQCQQTVWNQENTNKKMLTINPTADMFCNIVVQAANEVITDKLVNADSITQYLRHDCTKLPNENGLIEKVG